MAEAKDDKACPSTREETEIDYASWNRCIRHGAWSVGLGMLFGTMGTVLLASDAPVMVGTGLGVGWALKYCRAQYRMKEEQETLERTEGDESCSCCNESASEEFQASAEEDACDCGYSGTQFFKDQGPRTTGKEQNYVHPPEEAQGSTKVFHTGMSEGNTEDATDDADDVCTCGYDYTESKTT